VDDQAVDKGLIARAATARRGVPTWPFGRENRQLVGDVGNVHANYPVDLGELPGCS
jgi:hypothetical protein